MVMLSEAVKIIVETCAGVSPKEEVLIISDKIQDPQIIEALQFAVEESEGKVGITTFPELSPEGDLPEHIVESMSSADIVFACSREAFSYNNFNECMSSGTRVLCMFRTALSSLTRSILIDYDVLEDELHVIARKIESSKSVTITTPGGASVKIDLIGKKPVIGTGLAREKGEIAFIPAGFVAVAPKELTSKGRFIINGSIQSIGQLRKPLMAVIQRGKVTDLADDYEYPMVRRRLAIDSTSNFLGTLGVGVNSKAKLCGEAEDNVVRGSIQLGFGNNKFFGGEIQSRSYINTVSVKGTLLLDGETLIESSKIRSE